MAVRTRNNRLYLDFYIYLPNGKRTRCFESTGLFNTKKSLKIAESKDKAIKYHIETGSFNYLTFFPHGSKAKHFDTGSDMLLADWWKVWRDEKSIRPNSQINLKTAYNHIGQHFGHMPLSQIGEHEILVFRTMLQGSLKENTINTFINTLCSALLKAHKRGLIPNYPCEDIHKLKEAQVRINPFSFDELKHWLNDLKSRNPEWHDMILFWSRTGLRPGELYALKWIDLDSYNRKISIQRTRQSGGGDGPPKTSYSIRDITLRPVLISCLCRQEARTGLQNGYIWLNNGRTWNRTAMGDKFSFYLRLAKLKYRPPKQMRHTFATLNLAAGEQPSWVSKTLGHSNVDITFKKYNRFIPNLTREDGSAFEGIMDKTEIENGNIKVMPLVSA